MSFIPFHRLTDHIERHTEEEMENLAHGARRCIAGVDKLSLLKPDLLRRRSASRETCGEVDLYEVAGLDAEERAEVARLEERLAELPGEQREAVYLHLYQGLTFREVGKATGVSTHTAASRYRLALGRLRRELGAP